MKAVCISVLLLLSFSCKGPSEESPEAKAVDSLRTGIRQLRAEKDSLITQLKMMPKLPEYFDSIADPRDFLLNRLNENKELIPRDPVLGGSMRFVGVEILNEYLLLADYEDGHIMGRSVYSYRPGKEGELRFNLVGSLRQEFLRY